MTEMTQAARVIAAFGGRTRMERDTPHSYATIRRWDETGFISAKCYQSLLDLAYHLGLDLTPHDFIAHLVEPAQRATESAAA